MGSLGRNFDWRTPPEARNRDGRHFIARDGSAIPIGAPIMVDLDADDDGLGRTAVVLATSATARSPAGDGLQGVLDYTAFQYIGVDPVLTRYSDIDTAPAGKAVQLVTGPALVGAWTNTRDRTYVGQRNYAGRVMVAGMGATPTVAVGDLLGPGAGNDDDGYWDTVDDPDDAWLVVTFIDFERGSLEARLRV